MKPFLLCALAVAALACAPSRLPRMKSPQPCCVTAEDVRRLDRKRILLEGIYTTRDAAPAAVKTEGPLVAVRDPARPAGEAERLAGRHVIIMGRLHAVDPEPYIDEIERIDVY